jgi:hypothetical protein
MSFHGMQENQPNTLKKRATMFIVLFLAPYLTCGERHAISGTGHQEKNGTARSVVPPRKTDIDENGYSRRAARRSTPNLFGTTF